MLKSSMVVSEVRGVDSTVIKVGETLFEGSDPASVNDAIRS